MFRSLDQADFFLRHFDKSIFCGEILIIKKLAFEIKISQCTYVNLQWKELRKIVKCWLAVEGITYRGRCKSLLCAEMTLTFEAFLCWRSAPPLWMCEFADYVVSRILYSVRVLCRTQFYRDGCQGTLVLLCRLTWSHYRQRSVRAEHPCSSDGRHVPAS